MKLLQVNNVFKYYNSKGVFSNKKSETRAVDGVSLNLDKGKCLGIVGESGCGKSTLARMITGIENPDKGEIIFEGERISASIRNPIWRKDIQIVYQDCVDALNPKMTAAQVLKEPLKNFFNLGGEKLRKKQEELMEIVGLLPIDLDKKTTQFSGGQLQRICIARALAAEPKLIVLDEPLSSLDVSVQAQILNLLQDIKCNMGVSYILISHDIEAVYYLADSLVIMYSGNIIESIDDITNFKELSHPYTKRLIISPSEEIEEDFIYEKEQIIFGCKYVNRCSQVNKNCYQNSCDLIEIENGHYSTCILYKD